MVRPLTEEDVIVHRDYLRHRVSQEGHDHSLIRFPYPPLSEAVVDAMKETVAVAESYRDPLAAAIGQAPL